MPIEKQENGKTIKYKIIFTDSVRFIVSFNLAKGLHKGKYKDCMLSFEYMKVKKSMII